METIEKKVTDAILQRATSVLEVNGVSYPIAPPTPATLILISEQIAEMPGMNLEAENILLEVLSKAKHCEPIGKIAAILILGAKRVKEHRTVKIEKVVPTSVFSWKKLRKVTKYQKELVEVDELDHLASLILEDCSNRTLRDIVAQRLNDMQVSDFFGITTSLSEVNLLKRTKEVETASGE